MFHKEKRGSSEVSENANVLPPLLSRSVNNGGGFGNSGQWWPVRFFPSLITARVLGIARDRPVAKDPYEQYIARWRYVGPYLSSDTKGAR